MIHQCLNITRLKILNILICWGPYLSLDFRLLILFSFLVLKFAQISWKQVLHIFVFYYLWLLYRDHASSIGIFHSCYNATSMSLFWQRITFNFTGHNFIANQLLKVNFCMTYNNFHPTWISKQDTICPCEIINILKLIGIFFCFLWPT